MDRRQRKTRNAIFQAFSALLETKRYSAITVQDIIDAADVGRSTFYAHFDTKEELLRAMCDDIFEHVFSAEVMREPEHDFSSADSFRDRITHILCHLQEKQHHIKGIFAGECGEIFMKYLREYLRKVFDRRLPEDRPGDGAIPRDYRLNHAVSAFAEGVRWWFGGHSGYTPEQISAFFFGTVDC